VESRGRRHYFWDEWLRQLMVVGDSQLGTRLVGHSELGAATSTKALWWDLRLASLLTNLFVCLSVCLLAKFAQKLPNGFA